MTKEKTLIEWAKQGDEDAFAEIVSMYGKAVYNSALYIAKNREDAEDISQEVFVRLWRTLSDYRGDASIKTWIATITKNCAIDYIRNRNKRSAFSLTDEEENREFDVVDEDVSSNPEKSFERDEKVRAVRSAVGKLEGAIKEAVILREFHNMSYAEIADCQGVSEGTVKSRISRGREQIKEILKSGNFL